MSAHTLQPLPSSHARAAAPRLAGSEGSSRSLPCTSVTRTRGRSCTHTCVRVCVGEACAQRQQALWACQSCCARHQHAHARTSNAHLTDLASQLHTQGAAAHDEHRRRRRHCGCQRLCRRSKRDALCISARTPHAPLGPTHVLCDSECAPHTRARIDNTQTLTSTSALRPSVVTAPSVALPTA
jgi:hypothetical protein